MLEQALQYARMGFKVLPLYEKKKNPLTRNGFHDASIDPNQIEHWWTQWPRANIGIVLERHAVIDIDVHDKSKNGFVSLAEFDLPETVAVNTASGGRHYFFKIKDGQKVDRKPGFRNGIDILVNGYVVAPCSVNEEGGKYTWMEGCSPDVIGFADLPDEFCAGAKPKVPQYTPWEPAKKVEIDRNRLEQRAILYLQKCEPAIEGCCGHNQLLCAASAMVNGFDFSPAVAKELLWSHYNPMCSPPWDRSNPSDVRDFERKVDEAQKGCDRQPGWLIGDDEYVDSKPDISAGIASAAALLENHKKKEKKEQVLFAKKELDPPPAIVYDKMPKLIGMIKGYLDDTAIVDQPWLNLAASLSLVSLITGKKWKYRGQRTNLFIISSAPSSSGKENGRKGVKKILAKCGMLDLLGGETVTSDKAILRVIIKNKGRVLYPWDECSHFFSANKDKNAGTHNKLIAPTLMALYSSADGVYMGKDYADGDNDVAKIVNPHCCIYGTTTPAMLYKAFSAEDAESGDMARMLFFQSIDEPRPRFFFNTDDPSDELCEKIKEVADILAVAEGAEGLMKDMDGLTTTCTELTATQEAEQYLIDYQQKMHDIKVSEDEGSIKAIVGKCFELMMRCTIIAAVSNDHKVIQLDDAEWACNLVEHLVMQCVSISRKKFDNNETKDRCEAVVKFLEKSNSEWVTHGEILRGVRKIKKTQDLKEIIQDLMDGYNVESTMDGKSRKYRLKS